MDPSALGSPEPCSAAEPQPPKERSAAWRSSPSGLVASSIRAPPVLERPFSLLRSPAASDTSTCSLLYRYTSAALCATCNNPHHEPIVCKGASEDTLQREGLQRRSPILLHFGCWRLGSALDELLPE
jgi:hypothetical protein